ncbi:hypothetical protein FQN57_001699 [Myotisia sp. PD_48]|nr:hypothetical protein FQN57_001699 [Myotisia sp. PD_48]
MSFFSRVFRGKDGKKSKQNGAASNLPTKPKWTDAWLRTEVTPEEVQGLLRGCTIELKARALDIPFLLLPFRPSSDPSAARTFIRNYFNPPADRNGPMEGEYLMQELRLTEPMVLCSVVKWCWARLPGGIVTWEAYELFKVGEQDADLARDAFSTFIPISVDSEARTQIIFDFFELMAAVAAHGKTNGLGGRKLSRYAGWWAFEHSDSGKGFEASYKTWAHAADATSHLFFAYLRSQSPDSIRGTNGISKLPISLQNLVQATEYPPEAPSLLQTSTTKVVMVVEIVSPTPFALLRRAKGFEYRESDHALQKFSSYDDPVRALTEECRRVLHCISTTNQSDASTSKTSTSLRDASWSRFEDIGFGGAIEESEREELGDTLPSSGFNQLSLKPITPQPHATNFGRPTTPSWADFLSSGFAEENQQKSRPTLLLPPDKFLPPLETARGQSSQSHKRGFDDSSILDPGELANISTLDLDDSFWWVWVSSLAGEEPASRKAVFGRCALLETIIPHGKWLVLEEQVKGAAPEPEAGAYVAEKKSFFGFRSRKGRLARRKSSAKNIPPVGEQYKLGMPGTMSKTSIGPDQHARIQAAAARLQKKHRDEQEEAVRAKSRYEDRTSDKTNSTLTMQPAIISEASQAMKWAHNYDKDSLRAAYLGNSRAGTGAPATTLELTSNGHPQNEPKAEPPTAAALAAATAAVAIAADKPDQLSQEKVAPPATKINDRHSIEQTVKPQPAKQISDPAKAQSGESRPDIFIQESSGKPIHSPEEHRKLKKKPGNVGLKGMFGKKKQDTTSSIEEKARTSSAVAAARAALEGRTAQVHSSAVPSSLKASPSHRLSGFGLKKGSDTTPSSTKPTTPEKPAAAPSQHQVSPVSSFDGPPRTDRDAEYDALSRVDTNEQAQADREFSSFDHQSPIVDQPAFVPADTPSADALSEISSPSSSIRPPAPSSDPIIKTATPASTEPVEPAVPLHDRWAQIRKNAAERAALPSDVATPELSKPAPRRPTNPDTNGQQESKYLPTPPPDFELMDRMY